MGRRTVGSAAVIQRTPHLVWHILRSNGENGGLASGDLAFLIHEILSDAEGRPNWETVPVRYTKQFEFKHFELYSDEGPVLFQDLASAMWNMLVLVDAKSKNSQMIYGNVYDLEENLRAAFYFWD